MAGYEKTTNFLASFGIYIIISVIVVISASKILTYSNHFKFYSGYLLNWERAITRLTSQETPLPVFNGNNHVKYMDGLIAVMKSHAIEVPRSSTGSPYIYKLPGRYLEKDNTIFLLCLDQRIVLFGLSKTIFNMLDKKIDGKPDARSGNFKGRELKSHAEYTGIWDI